MTEESFEAAAQLERQPVQPLVEITNRMRHRQCINALAFSADGRLLASGSKDTTVRLWDVRNGEYLTMSRKANPSWPIDALAVSKNGREIAYVTRGKKKSERDYTRAFLWDVHGDLTIEIARKHRHKYEFGIPSFSPDETAVAFAERSILLFDTASGELLKPQFDGGLCSVLAFSPNGKMLASNSRSGTIHIWDVATGNRLSTLAGHSQWVRCLSFSPDNRELVSTSDDGTMRVWRVPHGEATEVVDDDQEDTACHLGFLFDGRRFVTFHKSDRGGFLQIQPRIIYPATRQWQPNAGSYLTAAAISPDGQLLATGDYEGKLKVWRVDEVFGDTAS